jgi:predicted Zn-ribbon and HTH transcriptional regulator
MQVYSSNQVADGLFDMPTVNLREVDQAERDKKVKELYPIFENDLKENILDYARTVKSLGDNEQLVFNVKLTKCKGCGIPRDIEVSVKNSVLKDYSSGKLDKNSALGKITVKKGLGQ